MSTGTVPQIRTRAALRDLIRVWRRDGLGIGLVPTMGALHAGHLSLIERARSASDRVVVSLFVNPRQFGPGEDFAAYPRTEDDDLAKLASAGVDAAWLPSVDEMYPAGFATSITVGGIAETLEGAHRPGHFNGVATVVAKLLLQVLPDAAYFGEKDYQQLQVVRRLVRDLDIPVRIVPVETVRESDGLALSSRNRYLSPDERRRAVAFPVALRQVATQAAAHPEGPFEPLLETARRTLAEAGFGPIDYVAICDTESLAPVSSLAGPCRVLGAARIGRTRLIDNLPVLRADLPYEGS
ncbi:MAG TPA: pantoate--beta-alanine ligase [Stellaceae bacterium]|nr:pantoate--beta-alanine ligase [Stellaceae bacterium]